MIDRHDSMNMVRHNDEKRNGGIGIMLRNLLPLLLAKLPYGTEMHNAILYFTKVMSLILSADSYEVDTSFVIVKKCAGRFPIMVTRGTHNKVNA